MTKSEYIRNMHSHLCGQFAVANKYTSILNYINARPAYLTIKDNEANIIIVSIKIVSFTRPAISGYNIKVTDILNNRFHYIEINEPLND